MACLAGEVNLFFVTLSPGSEKQFANSNGLGGRSAMLRYLAYYQPHNRGGTFDWFRQTDLSPFGDIVLLLYLPLQK
jgi:hypothetical protein